MHKLPGTERPPVLQIICMFYIFAPILLAFAMWLKQVRIDVLVWFISIYAVTYIGMFGLLNMQLWSVPFITFAICAACFLLAQFSAGSLLWFLAMYFWLGLVLTAGYYADRLQYTDPNTKNIAAASLFMMTGMFVLLSRPANSA